MSLTADDVREILRLLEESSFDELVLETDGLKLVLRRGGAAGTSLAPDAPVAASDSHHGEHGEHREASVSSVSSVVNVSEPGVVDVPSPMLGVFYRAPKPGAAPFIEVGQRVEPDTVIAIIEVMKLMNTVRAGVAGEVVEICAENAKMVEYEQTLIRVRVDE